MIKKETLFKIGRVNPLSVAFKSGILLPVEPGGNSSRLPDSVSRRT